MAATLPVALGAAPAPQPANRLSPTLAIRERIGYKKQLRTF